MHYYLANAFNDELEKISASAAVRRMVKGYRPSGSLRSGTTTYIPALESKLRAHRLGRVAAQLKAQGRGDAAKKLIAEGREQAYRGRGGITKDHGWEYNTKGFRESSQVQAFKTKDHPYPYRSHTIVNPRKPGASEAARDKLWLKRHQVGKKLGKTGRGKHLMARTLGGRRTPIGGGEAGRFLKAQKMAKGKGLYGAERVHDLSEGWNYKYPLKGEK